MQTWAARNGVELRFIQPGKQVQIACIESFNCRFRDECVYLLLSALMLAGTAAAYYVDLVELNLPSALLVAIEVLVVVCVFGWLPMLIAGIVSLRRQTRESVPNQGET